MSLKFAPTVQLISCHTLILVSLPLRCLFIARDAVDKEVGHEFDQLEDHDDGDTQKETESAPEAGEKTIQLRKKGVTQPMTPFFGHLSEHTVYLGLSTILCTSRVRM